MRNQSTTNDGIFGTLQDNVIFCNNWDVDFKLNVRKTDDNIFDNTASSDNLICDNGPVGYCTVGSCTSTNVCPI